MNFELHEFEAYLYCNPDAFSVYGKKAPEQIKKIVKEARGPENINTRRDTLPSRRLDNVIEGYTRSKILYTSGILEHLTLEQIRQECVHFDYWIDRVCKKMNSTTPSRNPSRQPMRGN